MRKNVTIMAGAAAAALALASCGQEQAGEEAAIEAVDVASESMADTGSDVEVASDAEAAAETVPAGDIPTLDAPPTLPKIAYSYSYGFALPGEAIVPLQQRHADMCEAKGPTTCRILGMTGASAETDGNGTLELAVRSDMARSFGSELASAATDTGAEQQSTGIVGEDLSKQLIDTEARLETRIALRDRLMADLKTRRNVNDMVAAEREVARITEEIEGARNWLAEMRGRVSFSTITLSYESSTPMATSFAAPIGDAFASVGGILGTVISWLILLGAALLPIGAVVWLAARVNRWAKRREIEVAS